MPRRKKAAPTKRDQVSFDSLHELSRWVQSTPRREGSSKSSEDTAVCAVGIDQALDIAAHGGRHATDVERLKSAMAGIPKTSRLETLSPQVVSDVIGFAPIVPNAMMGLPDSMLNLQDIEAPAPVIRVGVHVGRNWRVTENTVYYRAAALLAALDVLHAHGHKTELWACWRNQDDDGNAVFADVLVKPSNAQWDFEVASFCFGNPAMQRRLFWACGERSGEAGESVTRDSYGSEAHGASDGFDVYFPRLADDLYSVHDAQGHVSERFAESGLTVDYG